MYPLLFLWLTLSFARFSCCKTTEMLFDLGSSDVQRCHQIRNAISRLSSEYFTASFEIESRKSKSVNEQFLSCFREILSFPNFTLKILHISFGPIEDFLRLLDTILETGVKVYEFESSIIFKATPKIMNSIFKFVIAANVERFTFSNPVGIDDLQVLNFSLNQSSVLSEIEISESHCDWSSHFWKSINGLNSLKILRIINCDRESLNRMSLENIHTLECDLPEDYDSSEFKSFIFQHRSKLKKLEIGVLGKGIESFINDIGTLNLDYFGLSAGRFSVKAMKMLGEAVLKSKIRNISLTTRMELSNDALETFLETIGPDCGVEGLTLHVYPAFLELIEFTFSELLENFPESFQTDGANDDYESGESGEIIRQALLIILNFDLYRIDGVSLSSGKIDSKVLYEIYKKLFGPNSASLYEFSEMYDELNLKLIHWDLFNSKGVSSIAQKLLPKLTTLNIHSYLLDDECLLAISRSLEHSSLQTLSLSALDSLDNPYDCDMAVCINDNFNEQISSFGMYGFTTLWESLSKSKVSRIKIGSGLIYSNQLIETISKQPVLLDSISLHLRDIHGGFLSSLADYISDLPLFELQIYSVMGGYYDDDIEYFTEKLRYTQLASFSLNLGVTLDDIFPRILEDGQNSQLINLQTRSQSVLANLNEVRDRNIASLDRVKAFKRAYLAKDYDQAVRLSSTNLRMTSWTKQALQESKTKVIENQVSLIKSGAICVNLSEFDALSRSEVDSILRHVKKSSVKIVDVSRVPVNATIFDYFWASKVESLIIGDNPHIDDYFWLSLFKFLKGGTRLKSLDLSNTDIPEKHFRTLATVLSESLLDYLDISGQCYSMGSIILLLRALENSPLSEIHFNPDPNLKYELKHLTELLSRSQLKVFPFHDLQLTLDQIKDHIKDTQIHENIPDSIDLGEIIQVNEIKYRSFLQIRKDFLKHDCQSLVKKANVSQSKGWTVKVIEFCRKIVQLGSDRAGKYDLERKFFKELGNQELPDIYVEQVVKVSSSGVKSIINCGLAQGKIMFLLMISLLI